MVNDFGDPMMLCLKFHQWQCISKSNGCIAHVLQRTNPCVFSDLLTSHFMKEDEKKPTTCEHLYCTTEHAFSCLRLIYSFYLFWGRLNVLLVSLLNECDVILNYVNLMDNYCTHSWFLEDVPFPSLSICELSAKVKMSALCTWWCTMQIYLAHSCSQDDKLLWFKWPQAFSLVSLTGEIWPLCPQYTGKALVSRLLYNMLFVANKMCIQQFSKEHCSP